MNLKRFLTLLLALILVLSLASCKKCKDHVDADDDYLCDNCGEHYDDGDEQPDDPNAGIVEKDVTFTVKLDNGEILSYVSFTVSGKAGSFELVSGSDGTVKQTLAVGTYSVSFGDGSLPEFCTPDTFGFKVEEGTASVDIVIIDNTPDGSVEKPFFISENETSITLAPGQELFYNYRGSSPKYIIVNNEGAVVNFGGESYEAENGAVTLFVVPEIGKATVFSIENNTDEEFTATLSLVAPLGSSENPIELTESSATVSVSEEETVYYKWVADKDGVIVLTSQSEHNSISLTKVLENDVLVISQTGGRSAAYLVVSAGDEITVGVSALNAPEKVEIGFALVTYAGTNNDPVPVLMDEIDISLAPDSEIVFSGETGKTLRITDDNMVAVWHDTITYTNEEGNDIVVELLKPIFILENREEHINGVTVTFE